MACKSANACKPAHHALLRAFVLCALFIHALLPNGFMPVQMHGETQIVICTGSGPVKMTVGADNDPHAPAPQQNQKSDCAFQALHQPVATGAEIALASPVYAIWRSALSVTDGYFVAHERLAGSLGARGPPAA